MTIRSVKKNQVKKQSWVKRVIQIGFFLFVLLLVLSHTLKERGISLPLSTANFHAICPFGAVETVGRLITQAKFIPKTNSSNLWIFLASIASAALIGAVFCGWLCPLGSLQYWIGKFGKKIFKKRYNRIIPPRLDHLLGYLRYIVLIIIVVQTTRLLTLVFVRVDPYYALFHFWTGEALLSAVIVLGLVVTASLFMERPWCRWLCPFGAVQGLVQLISPWKIRRDEKSCISCGLCSKACPMRIPVDKKKAVLDTRCNRCGECLAVCPAAGALDHSLGKIKFSLKNRFITAALVLVIFAAPVIIAQQTGLYKTSNKPVISEGRMKIEEIRSSLTIDELAVGFSLEVPFLLEYLGLPDTLPGSTRLKDIEDVVEDVTTRTIRARMEAFGAD